MCKGTCTTLRLMCQAKAARCFCYRSMLDPDCNTKQLCTANAVVQLGSKYNHGFVLVEVKNKNERIKISVVLKLCVKTEETYKHCNSTVTGIESGSHNVLHATVTCIKDQTGDRFALRPKLTWCVVCWCCRPKTKECVNALYTRRTSR